MRELSEAPAGIALHHAAPGDLITNSLSYT